MTSKEIDNYSPPIYELSDVENWKTYINDNGFVVFKNILILTELEEAKQLFKKNWSEVTPNFKWDDITTWKTDNCPMIWSKGSVVYNGFGQSEFMWYLRTKSNIKKPFDILYNDDNLAVSFDGASVFLSTQQKSERWLHIDQNPEKHEVCYQGSFNILPVNDNSAGFIIVPGSHKSYSPNVSHSKDWILIDDNDEHQFRVKKLIIPANCLTIWNSKTIHANTGISKKKGSKHIFNLDRITSYISFQPKIRISKQIQKDRIDAYKASITTSHWVDKLEKKIVPFRIRKKYEQRSFNTIKSQLINGNEIPPDYFRLI